jgi:hypothetical protein
MRLTTLITGQAQRWPDTIFLCSKCKSDERNAIQVEEVTRERINAIVANEQLHVAETKRVALTRTAVIAGSKQPTEHHVAQVRLRKADLVAVEGGHLVDIVEDGDWKRFDTRRWWVLLGVAAELVVKAKIEQVHA